MTIAPIAKQQIYHALDRLAPDELAQIVRVVGTMQKRKTPPVRLAGLWSDIEFDVDHRTVRRLRQQISRHALRRKV